MANAHTPGPWMVNGYAIEARDPADRGVYIAHVEDDDNGGSVESVEASANARLIAAAPELATALRNLIAAMDERDYRLMETTPARAVLAKIDGVAR